MKGFILFMISLFCLTGCSNKEVSLEEMNSVSVDTSLMIAEKCNYGDDIDKLNKYERVIYVVNSVSDEVNNGGFGQYLLESSGNFANETVDAFNAIGYKELADICQKVLDIFGGSLPVDYDERNDIILNMDCDDELAKYDSMFYNLDSNKFDELCYKYIMKHKIK